MTRTARHVPDLGYPSFSRVVPEHLVRRYLQAGWWTEDTLGDVVAAGLAAVPDNQFKVHSDTRPFSGTFGDVERLARRLAGGLHARGVVPGDLIAFQLPNWVEAAATFWASSLLGAVVVPVVHFYGPKELGYILAGARPKVFITAEGFGRMVFRPELCADVPVVAVVGRDFDELLDPEPMAGTLPADPDSPALIAYTSGTTNAPKGIIHSHRTLIAEARQLVDQWKSAERLLTAAPVGHFAGMESGLLIPLLSHRPINLIDEWDPAKALALMKSEDLSLSGGPPYFFTSLLNHPDMTSGHLAHFKSAAIGGATVPVAVMRQLDDSGITVSRSYGSTEHPSITGSRSTDPTDKRLLTDGRPMAGVEIRLTDDGEILSRGPDLCLGYTDPELTAATFDAEGWYHTGDTGVLDDDGHLTITDRKSDLIIRGGENVSAMAVEEVLLGMPAVAEAAVVAAPDERLGERVAAVVRPHTGQPLPSVAEVHEHFAASGIGRQTWPEEIHRAEDFPRTSTGKVQKALLRKCIAPTLPGTGELRDQA
jgi:acyl-CoA synthetase